MTRPIVTLWRCRIETSAEGVLEQRLYELLCEDWPGKYVVSMETPRETREACGLYCTGPFTPGAGPYYPKAERLPRGLGLSPVEAVELEQRRWVEKEEPRRRQAWVDAKSAIVMCEQYREQHERKLRADEAAANAAKGWR